MYKNLFYDIKEGVATITLNRPESNNAFDEALFREVTEAVIQSENDDKVKVIVITGSGKNFSSGGDINAMATFEFITPELSALASKMTGSVRRCPKPVIAMINGTAAGAGFALALSCDFRIMTEKSTILTAFSNVALSGDSGSMYHLYHMVGLAKTTELMFLSKPIKGEEALRLGLTTVLSENDALEEETLKFAHMLMTRPLAAFAKQKKIYYDIFYHDFEEYSKLEAELFVESTKTEDHHEAVMAFLENRKPVFVGK